MSIRNDENKEIYEDVPCEVTEELAHPIVKKQLKEVKKKGYTEWIVGDNNRFIPTEPIETTPKLVPGKYKIIWDNDYNRWAYMREEINSDELLNLPSETFTQILTDIDFFWNHKHLFDKYKYVHKRGILLYGTPGCGKSSICQLLTNQVIEKGGIVLNVNNSNVLSAYSDTITSIFRFIEPDTKILTIFEDLDGLVRDPEVETLLLNILDGNNQLNNVLNIGCTNYPEHLKERILNRPSRFDRRYKIGLPDSKIREFYLRHKINKEDLDEDLLKDIVLKTEGLTLAHLGEFIKSVFIFGVEINETIDMLKGMSEFISSRQDTVSNVGFNTKKNIGLKNYSGTQGQNGINSGTCG